MLKKSTIARDILLWYDKNARIMPWRISPQKRSMGVLPNPYHVWLSEIMLQQTTVVTVIPYFKRFIIKWPRIEMLAAASDGDVMATWAGLGYYARARNLLKCARVICDLYDGNFPQTDDKLRSLPGIGLYTSAAIQSIAFDIPATVVDGNIERIMSRLHMVETPLPIAKKELYQLAKQSTPSKRSGDYAQALMDLGASLCSTKSPSCTVCPLASQCLAYARGNADKLPQRIPKPKKPVRFGHIYVAIHQDGSVLLEQRPNHGLLGGMLGWPGSDWYETPPQAIPPITANWQKAARKVKHTFTHFHLELDVYVARNIEDKSQPFTPRSLFQPASLPTVMQKVWNIASECQ